MNLKLNIPARLAGQQAPGISRALQLNNEVSGMHGLRVQVGGEFSRRLRSVRTLSYENKEKHPLLKVSLS